MTQDEWLGIIIILFVISIAAFGGAKLSPVKYPASYTQTQNSQSGMQVVEGGSTPSPYQNGISLVGINRNNNPSSEYVTITMSRSAKANIDITGWTLKSLSSGQSFQIPQGVYLYFTNSGNSKDDIILTPGDTVYLVTGTSPNGTNFKANECSGYLEQFQTFTPYIQKICPLASNENLGSIPRYPINNDCFDYIASYPRCKTQTDPLPAAWSLECKNFIQNTENYPECITLHKNDPGFYQPEWHVYLNHTGSIWQTEREDVVLYDRSGKVVSELKY